MENKCNMCGQCCRMVHFPANSCIGVNDGSWVSEDAVFVRENMEYLGSSEHVTGFRREWPDGTEYFGVYKCNLLTDNNLCSIHENKPRVCSDYPWYGCSKSENSSGPWPYHGCGYEKDAWDQKLLKVLNLIRDKKIYEKRGKEGKSDLLSVREA